MSLKVSGKTIPCGDFTVDWVGTLAQYSAGIVSGTITDDNTGVTSGNNTVPFAMNSGAVDANGNSDILKYSGGTLTTNTATTNLVATNAFGKQIIVNTAKTLDMSGYTNGTYNVFLKEDGTLEVYNNNIFKQKNKPVIINNFVKTGCPKISNGIVSNCTESSYLSLPSTFNPSSNSWEILFMITTGSDVVTRQMVAIGIGISIEVRSGKFGMLLSNAAGAWYISSKYGSYTVLPNTTYYLKTVFSGSAYIQSYSLDGVNFTADTTVPTSTAIMASNINLCANPADGTCKFLGSMDLTKSYIKIGNGYFWKCFPLTSNDIWLNTSVEPLSAYKYGTDWSTKYIGVPIGTATVFNGVINAVTTNSYNQNGYNLNIYTSSNA